MKRNCLLLSLILLTISVYSQQVFEVSIASSNDDVEEHGETSLTPGAMYFNSSDLEMVSDTLGGTKRGDQTTGLRFTDINIPGNATITSSYIQFTSDSPHDGDITTNLTIWVEDTADAAAFTSTDYDASSRKGTNGSVQWLNIPFWESIGEAGTDQQTPDLSVLVQHLINKSTWTSGNSMVFIIQGTGIRRAAAWDESPALAPKLIITYSKLDTIIEVEVCDTYISPSGKNWTKTGVYLDTIPDHFGGDSIISIDLTINNSTTSYISKTVCDDYTSPSGKEWTVSGTYKDTIPNAAGCDSVITIDLTVNGSTTSGISKTVCDSYTSPSGKVWTVSGTYKDTIPNAAGCDSVITIDLTVNGSTTSGISKTVCDSYTSPGGKVWTVSGTYKDTIPNAAGCDSVITIDLTVNGSTTSGISKTACDSYTSPSGKMWTVSGTYKDTIPNAAGCDSVITVDLTIDCSNSIFSNTILKASIYPNPTKGMVTIVLEKKNRRILVEVYTLTGQQLISEEFFDAQQVSFNLGLTPNTYMIRVTNDSGNLNLFKVLKQ